MFIQFLESLSSQESEKYQLIEIFSEWLLDQTDALSGRGGNHIKGDWNQRRTQLNQSINYLTFCDTQGIGKEFKRFLSEQSQKGNIRKYRINSPLSERKLQVRGQLVDGNQRIYIPGTSIKGAIRTALLYKALMSHGEDYQKDLIKEIERGLSNRRGSFRQVAKRIGSGIEHAMAYGGTRKNLEHSPRYDDVQQDVFKFLYVSDAILESNPIDPVEVVKTDLYLVTNVSRNS
ncbi:MAG: type III-A CRISPR-associated RAMP protein Csm5, partial [Bacteroidota bacterium]